MCKVMKKLSMCCFFLTFSSQQEKNARATGVNSGTRHPEITSLGK